VTRGLPEASVPSRREGFYETDGALTEQERDSFGRWEFSVAIADLLATRPDTTSMVVGVNAPRGAGKTTVLNFIDGHLEQCHPEVLRVRYRL
jgi:predicted KAP-like P-loop ATPase